jgi:hypothetical protein
MMNNPSRIIVLVEDQHHEMLVRRCLKRYGLNEHKMRMNRSPSGRGSAEGWVRKEFPKEIKAYRRRQASAQTGLIVMIDADAHSVQERLNQLDQASTESAQQAVGEQERIARLVPKRNVETWILCLNNEPGLDENTNYTRDRRNWHALIAPAAETLCQWTQSPDDPPTHCLSSLRIGVRELRRLRS